MDGCFHLHHTPKPTTLGGIDCSLRTKYLTCFSYEQDPVVDTAVFGYTISASLVADTRVGLLELESNTD